MEVVKILGAKNPKGDYELLYQVPSNKGCVISNLNICNTSVYDTNIYIAIHTGEYEVDDHLEYAMVVYGFCSAQRLKGVTLKSGDKISVYSSNIETNFHLFGSEFDQTITIET